MDQIINPQTLNELAHELYRRDIIFPNIVNGIYTLCSTLDELKEYLKNRTLDEVHDIVNGLRNKDARASCTLIIISEQQRKIHDLSKRVDEMDSDIKTLNEKMAVLIDALSVVGQKS